MPKLRVITKTPPEPHGEPEQQVAQLRDYLLQLCEELAYVLTHLEADNINDSTFQRIQEMIPKAYTGLPPMDGAASSGGTNAWSRGDHRHPHDDSKADAADLTAHVGDTANPHSVTKAQVGLGNVANERQYSADYPPPIPTPAQVGAIPTTEKGAANGVAELDANGMVPSAQLPSYVDDVLEYASQSAFPVSGESGKIYVALDTNKTYRWSGSAYVEISESLALGETSSTAYRGDRGKTAYDHSQVVSGNPHQVTAAEVGARPDTWTPSAADVGAQPSITANGILKGDGLGGVSAATAGTDYQAPLTAGTDYQTPLVAGTDYATPAMIPTVPDPSDAGPQDLGTADAGVSDDYSRADHVHNMPDAGDIDYDNTGSGLSATDVQAALDELAAGGGGGGPSPATATPVMDGSGAVGVSLLYAREDHEHPSDTGKQDTITASGILKGDGLGGVSAATAGTDYQAPLVAGTDYATPGMIPTVPAISTSTPQMDGTGAAGITGEVADAGHVHPSDTSRVPVYGMGENLLRNSGFSVNQRGIVSGSNSGSAVYTRSGWKNGRCSYTYNDDGTLTYAALSGQYSAFLIQYTPYDLRTKQITVSALIDGTLYSKTFTPGGDYENTLGGGVKIRAIYSSTGSHIGTEIQFKHDSQSGITLGYPKLELGSEQTLAHLEGSTWVLNEIPDYEAELIKCQTSTADSADTYANKTLATEQELAQTQVGAYANRAYAVGDCFCWNGLLYRVTSAINNGALITINSNCVQTTVMAEIVRLTS